MLPFLDKKKTVSVIMSKRGKNPDIEVNSEVEAPESDLDPSLKMAAEDILRAIETKSVIDLAKALKSAYGACEGGEPEMAEQEGLGE